MNSRTLNYNSINFPYYTFGEGQKHILILHGWGSQVENWQTFFKKADLEKFTFVFPELPGFGKSPNPPRAWTVDDYLDYSKTLYNSLETKPEFLLTHSFGSRIAIKWLNSKENPFKKAVFVGAAGIKPKLKLHKKIIKTLAPFFRFIKKIPILNKIAIKLTGSGDYAKATGVMRDTFKNVINEDLKPLLSTIDSNVKLVWGKSDTYTPLWMGQQMHELIPNSDLIVIDDAKHGVHMQTPEKLANIVEEFFN